MKATLLFLLFTFSTMLNAQTNSCACCTEKHADFDFWVGEWQVTNPDGSKAGTNTITKSQNNCLLQENWKSANGKVTGTSNNFYNYKTKQWEQIWVDNMGGSLHLKGERKGNQMIMQTDDEKNKNGETFYHRVTWTLNDDGSVHQYWETITNGKDVTVAFDGLYVKK
ncbi:hypothetical protein [Hanstruepera ponticola]|uniref:hypothetical protein n=1 Tax=Hanstruepera ponticola TaxID=2042995 RepID=UPI0017830EC5|nr:hypothetical protein [Hanstruepera ponticola]